MNFMTLISFNACKIKICQNTLNFFAQSHFFICYNKYIYVQLRKNEEELAHEMMGKISLSKDKVNLEKHVVSLSKCVVDLSKKTVLI